LGIFYRLFGLLEDALHKLDMAVALDMSSSGLTSTAATSLDRYVITLEQLTSLKEERQSLVAKAEMYDQVITM